MTQHELFFILGSYLIGAVPFGFILYYFLDGKDIRDEGSGNIGATNVYRVMGKTWGMITLVLDMLKGAIAVAYGLRHFHSPVIVLLGGCAVILGHLFPVYLKFRGGKGVASLVGMLTVFHFPAAVVFGLAFFPMLLRTKYVAAASLAGVTAAFFTVLFTRIAEISAILLVITILIIIKHRDNLRRINAGNESQSPWKSNG